MNTPEDALSLIEEAAAAWRPTRDGGVGSHPAWHDLDENGRREAFEVAAWMRRLESAADAEGLSGTARAVLTRIHGDR